MYSTQVRSRLFAAGCNDTADRILLHLEDVSVCFFWFFFILLNSIFSTFYSRPQTNGSAATIPESTVCKRILKKTQKRLLAKVTKFALCIICEVSFLGTESAQYSLLVSSKAGHRWRNQCWPVAQDCQRCCHIAVS